MALISTAELEAELTTLTTAQKAFETAVISAASNALRRWCGTVLESQAIDEICTPDPRTRRCFLKNKHVTDVSRVAFGPTGLLMISNTSAGGSRASVKFNVSGDPPWTSATGITLTSRASGVDTTTSLDFATYLTINDLQTAIGAVSGWTATQYDPTTYGTWATADLDVDAGVRSATSTGQAATLWAYVQDVPDWEFDPLAGVIVLKQLWGHNMGEYGDIRRPWGVKVSYTAGWLVIPDDLKQACVIVCKAIYDGIRLSGMFTSETSPEGYSYQLPARMVIIPEAAKQLAASYRRLDI